jgi:hypothetical protein
MFVCFCHMFSKFSFRPLYKFFLGVFVSYSFFPQPPIMGATVAFPSGLASTDDCPPLRTAPKLPIFFTPPSFCLRPSNYSETASLETASSDTHRSVDPIPCHSFFSSLLPSAPSIPQCLRLGRPRTASRWCQPVLTDVGQSPEC